MGIIDVTKFGADKSGKTDVSAAVTAAFSACKAGDTVVFPEGRYFIEKEIKVTGLDRVTVEGDNAVLVNHFCRTDFEGLSGAFGFSGCRDLVLKNLTFDYDVSPNSAGYISAIDAENGTFDIKIYDEFNIEGNEIMQSVMTMDDDLTPDYIIATYGHNKYEYLGNGTVRYKGQSLGCDVSVLHIGQKINIRHVIYGQRLVEFAKVDNCLIKDVTVYNAAGLVFYIGPGSSNFTFDGLKVMLPEGTNRLMAANADGIHVAGLSGEFVMKNCYFEQLGDDALNIHSIAGFVKQKVSDGELEIYHRRTETPLNPHWAAPGDIIYVHNRSNFLKKGEIKVISYEGMKLEYEPLSGRVEQGDVLVNSVFYCKTTITDCTVKNTRARAFLLQTHDVLLERNKIFGMSLAAFLFAPDIIRWYEVGPSENVIIRNNYIEKCAFIKHAANVGGIIVKSAHGIGGTDYPIGVHSNITVTGNTFKDIGDSGIYISATKGVTVTDNTFENCSCSRYDNRKKSIKYDIALVNCADVEVHGNRSDRGKSREIYCTNVRRAEID